MRMSNFQEKMLGKLKEWNVIKKVLINDGMNLLVIARSPELYPVRNTPEYYYFNFNARSFFNNEDLECYCVLRGRIIEYLLEVFQNCLMRAGEYQEVNCNLVKDSLVNHECSTEGYLINLVHMKTGNNEYAVCWGDEYPYMECLPEAEILNEKSGFKYFDDLIEAIKYYNNKLINEKSGFKYFDDLADLTYS